jgi:type I restriction enzyme R subunit
MARNIEEAFKLYSGDKPLGLFADKLEKNLRKMNEIYDSIEAVFRSAGIQNFEKLPNDNSERAQFAKLFKQFNNYLEAAKVQGFTWDKLVYPVNDGAPGEVIELHLDETTYLILALRYKELFSGPANGPGGGDVPYEIDTYLTEINTGVIDANYMNSRFKKYLKALQDGKETAEVLDELHKSFATLTQEEQKYANIFLHDVQNGDVTVEENKTLRDYITEYMARAKNDQLHRFATAIGMDEEALRSFMQLHVTAADINDFGRFDQLKATVDMDKARAFFEQQEGTPIKRFKVPMMVHHLLLRFILDGGFDIEKDY